jgi:hypothetical protein
MNDKINPSYYTQYEYQPIDFIANIFANPCDFFAGNIIKYICRHKQKGGLVDLKKAEFYLNKMIETQEDVNLINHRLYDKDRGSDFDEFNRFRDQLDPEVSSFLYFIFVQENYVEAKRILQQLIGNYKDDNH